jgi:hypothetical protein
MPLTAFLWNPTVNWRSQFILSEVSNVGVFDELPTWVLNQYANAEAGIVSKSEHQTVLKLPFITLLVRSGSHRAPDLQDGRSPESNCESLTSRMLLFRRVRLANLLSVDPA